MHPSDKDLLELAGWQAVKAAKALVAVGAVVDADRVGDSDEKPAIYKGLVQEGRKKLAAGLRIRSLTDADNLCSCPAARLDGQICGHSVAVVLVASSATKDDKGAIVLPIYNKAVKRDFTQIKWYPVLQIPLEKVAGRASVSIKIDSPDEKIAEQLKVAGAAPWPTETICFLESLGIELGGQPQLLELPKTQFNSLLNALRGGQLGARARNGPEIRTIPVANVPLRLPIRADLSETHQALLSRSALDIGAAMVDSKGVWILDSGFASWARFEIRGESSAFCSVIEKLIGDTSSASEAIVSLDWLRENADHLYCMFHMECSEELMVKVRVTPGNPRISLALEGSLKHLDLKLRFHYPADTTVNIPAEQQARTQLAIGGFDDIATISEPETSLLRGGNAKVKGERAILDFYAGPLGRLIADPDWEVEIGERFHRLTKDIERIRPKFETESSGTDWFTLDTSFETPGGQAIPEAAIRRLLETGQNRVPLANGRKAVIDSAAAQRVFDCFAESDTTRLDDAGTKGASLRRAEGAQALFLREILPDIGSFAGSGEHAKLPDMEGLKADLRDYQGRGVEWLWQRVNQRQGAILADEMGLGKTVQTLALIAALRGSRSSPSGLPVLILCPTSLLTTWRREAERFLPSASVLLLHGPKRRDLFTRIADNDIVLTSYGSLVRDVDEYPDELEFALAVADEASHLKNASTKTAKAASRVKAAAHLALTGTPVENSLADLWSIMQFSNPGYLGHRDDFLSRYAATTAAADQQTSKHLRDRMRPFLLRRTKSEVATDLPERLERVFYCDLTPSQKAVYEKLIAKGRAGFQQIVGTAGSWQKARFDVLALLMRLRQACCDLRLLDRGKRRTGADSDSAGSVDAVSTEELTSSDASAKLGALESLIAESLAGGHRCLIFSQFVGMLELIKDQLNASGHRYVYLDGATPSEKRAEAVEAFQKEGSEIPIFLISLKAGGYGLTLTGADTVIHFDPWWNPAVEAQATDRAHRIGQTRPVTAYKLIASGTVEEKILKLQEKKRGLIDGLLNETRPLMSSLSREDVEFVLS